MKLKQFSLSLILFVVCYTNNCFSQGLKNSDGLTHTLNSRQHLAFESNKGDSIIYYQGYSVIFSYKYNLPRYVFNLLSVDQITSSSTHPPVKRSSTFFPANLPNGKLSATSADYLKSGYHRGHMVPAADFIWNKELKDETSLFTNINPQKAALNLGLWANLESRIRHKVIKYSKNAYVVTGVIFNPKCEKKIGPNNLCVPTSFFKIIYFESKKIMYAFLFDNTVDIYEGDITDFQVTVDYIEKITGEDFFDLLSDDKEEEMESIIVKFND